MFRKILVPATLSPETDKVFEFASKLPGVKEVIALHTIESAEHELIKEKDEPGKPSGQGISPADSDKRHLHKEIKRREEKILEKGQVLRSAGITFRTIVDEVNTIDETIIEIAERENASSIVIGSHGKSSWEEILFGSVSEKVARKARTPVLLLRFDLMDSKTTTIASSILDRVLFPTDLRPSSDRVINLLQIMKPKEVNILYCVPKEGREDMDDKVRQKKLENIENDLKAAGIKTSVVLKYGDVLDDVLKFAEGSTSVVMASNGKGVIKEWLTGSISLNVARKAKVPVMLAHEGDTSF